MTIYHSPCLILLLLLSACQPKAKMTTIDHPFNNFSLSTDDSTRGAKSVEDLACDLFLSLKGDLNFDELSRFIPDSSTIARIYQITKTDTKDANLKANADSVIHQLRRDWVKTRSEAAELKANWGDATFEKLQIVDMEDQKLPSKKILLECKSGTTTLRASAKCLKIGERWFIGEDIKFGV